MSTLDRLPGSLSARQEAAWPSVSVVVATVDRPELLRRAVRSALGQHYPGFVEVIVVHDRTTPREVGVDVPARSRSLRVIANRRTPGLAGARNSGILAAAGDLIAFCDDDDAWEPDKLAEQVLWWRDHPEASAIATGITIRNAEGSHEHLPPERTCFTDLLRSRVLGLHPSAFLIRRSDLLGEVGLVDELLPQSYGEDYDLLLRLAQHGEIHAVQRPLLLVDWARSSHFDGKWDAMSSGLSYLLLKFPQLRRSRRGWARIAGQIAFAHAAQGHRGPALRWAAGALGRDPLQLRAYAACAVALGLVGPAWLLDQVQRRGRGL
jgi:glycosyltransferase involved in cell wall biosynthesis